MKKPNKFKQAGIKNKDLLEMGVALIRESGEAVVFAHKKNDGSGVSVYSCNTTGIGLRELCVGILADLFRVSAKIGESEKRDIEKITKLVLDALAEAKNSQ